MENLCRYIDQEKDGNRVLQYGKGKFNTIRLEVHTWSQSMEI
jgi:hypothetical protein